MYVGIGVRPQQIASRQSATGPTGESGCRVPEDGSRRCRSAPRPGLGAQSDSSRGGHPGPTSHVGPRARCVDTECYMPRPPVSKGIRPGRPVGWGSGEAAACSLQELTDEPQVTERVDDGALQHPFYRMRADRGARVFPHARRHGGTEMHGEGNRQRSRGASVRLRVFVSALLRDLRLLRDLNAIIRHFIQPGTTPQAASIGTPDFP